MLDKYFYYYQHIAEIDIIGTLPVFIDNIHPRLARICNPCQDRVKKKAINGVGTGRRPAPARGTVRG